MRSYRLFSLLILGLMLVSGSITLAQDSAPQLRDLPVFADQRYGMWAGSGDGLTLSVEDGSLLPIDEAMTRDGLPSLRMATHEAHSSRPNRPMSTARANLPRLRRPRASSALSTSNGASSLKTR